MSESAHAAAMAAIANLWEQGCPVAGPAERERTVTVGLRRLRSFHRRHPRTRQPSDDDKVRDLVRGLIETFEAEPRLVGPLANDYECVARAIAAAATRKRRPAPIHDQATVMTLPHAIHGTRERSRALRLLPGAHAI